MNFKMHCSGENNRYPALKSPVMDDYGLSTFEGILIDEMMRISSADAFSAHQSYTTLIISSETINLDRYMPKSGDELGMLGSLWCNYCLRISREMHDILANLNLEKRVDTPIRVCDCEWRDNEDGESDT